MPQIALNMYQTAAIAMMLFVLGRFLTNRVEFLRKCCIPAPVVGGLIFAIVHLCLYMGGIVEFTFDSNVKDFFMTLFFTSVGYTAAERAQLHPGRRLRLGSAPGPVHRLHPHGWRPRHCWLLWSSDGGHGH